MRAARDLRDRRSERLAVFKIGSPYRKRSFDNPSLPPASKLPREYVSPQVRGVCEVRGNPFVDRRDRPIVVV